MDKYRNAKIDQDSPKKRKIGGDNLDVRHCRSEENSGF